MSNGKIATIDYFKPTKWLSVIRAWFNKKPYQIHIIEQLMFRFIECQPCINTGHCLECGCSMNDELNKAVDFQASCSDGKWGPIMSKENWIAFKEKNNIKFLVTYNF